MNLSDYYNKTEIKHIDNELSALIVNTCNKHEKVSSLTDYYNIEYLNTRFELKANGLNTYTKTMYII